MTDRAWSPVTKQSKPYFTEEDTKKIYRRSSLGKKISVINDESQLEKITERLENAAYWYLTLKNKASGPKPAEIKKSLERVQKDAFALYKSLHEHLILPGLLPVELFEETKKNAKLIDCEAKKILEEFETTAHRPRNVARLIFIRMLTVIYEETTGNTAGLSRSRKNQKPIGPLFCFVKNCLEHIGAFDIGDEALFKSIQNAMKNFDKYKNKLTKLGL